MSALYNRYRPHTLSGVVGQEHVTAPLAVALSSGRAHHAYLFSGPRGCGKTTTARIVAMGLNCVDGPTPEPCGTCSSCQGILTNSSVDFEEIDAASHGGVDDIRDIRQNAYNRPMSSRYRIILIDEAHMVTSAGFNAFLKLVEEPPEHLKLLFATTEPEKVIGTIRSRTYHYPFRLVSPPVLTALISEITAAESITLAADAYAPLIRAGGGSVRDTLSLLGQLSDGAGPQGVSAQAVRDLLGSTDPELMASVLDALARRDSLELMGLVDRAMTSGADARRLTADILEALRDAVVLALSGSTDLLGPRAPGELDALKALTRYSTNVLTSLAGRVNDTLAEMSRSTNPRLVLELAMARLASTSVEDPALESRLDSIEELLRSIASGATVQLPPVATAPSFEVPSVRPVVDRAARMSEGVKEVVGDQPVPLPVGVVPLTEPEREAALVEERVDQPSQSTAMEPAQPATPSPTVTQPENPDTWATVVKAMSSRSKVGGAILRDQVKVTSMADNVVALTLPSQGLLQRLEAVRPTLAEVLGELFGGTWSVVTSVV